jgi:hypothetical protein
LATISIPVCRSLRSGATRLRRSSSPASGRISDK